LHERADSSEVEKLRRRKVEKSRRREVAEILQKCRDAGVKLVFGKPMKSKVGRCDGGVKERARDA